jgi:hypothetical protein
LRMCRGIALGTGTCSPNGSGGGWTGGSLTARELRTASSATRSGDRRGRGGGNCDGRAASGFEYDAAMSERMSWPFIGRGGIGGGAPEDRSTIAMPATGADGPGAAGRLGGATRP